jgi:arylsulfatase A-like enzyme
MMRNIVRLLAVCCLFMATAFAADQPPNIIFVLADDLGYGDLGCYGQETIATPNLDRMAAEGVRFTQVYAGSTVCAPSRCTLMTGQHTGHCFVRGNARIPLRQEDVTVAELLKEQGYTTALIGKWGLGEPDTTGIPNRKGFDYFFGYLNQGHAHNYYPEYLWRNEEKVMLEGNREGDHNRVSVEMTQYSHDLFVEDALGWLDKNSGAPFFLYLAFTLPHANNEATRVREGNGMEVPDLGPYADRDWPDPQKGHAAMIHRLDRDVGKVLDKLRELGVAENTLVIFTSDNGTHKEGGADPEFFNSSGPLRGYKRSMHDGGIRVPAIAWWPETLKPDQVSDQVWAFWDFLPTAVELAGGEAPEGIDGISFVPTLNALGLGGPTEQLQHDYLYWEFHERAFKQGVRAGDWKAVRENKGDLQLYDMSKDIGEENDVAVDNPEVVANIEAYLETARTPSEHWRIPGEKKAKK